MIDGRGATGQAGEAMGGWMSSENGDYTTPCGHERHRKTKQAPSPPGVSDDGARGDKNPQGEMISGTMRTVMDDITIGVPCNGKEDEAQRDGASKRPRMKPPKSRQKKSPHLLDW